MRVGRSRGLKDRTMDDTQKQWRRFWREEREAAYLYQQLAANEKSAKLAELYRRMADIELRHAQTWEEKLRTAGGTLPAFKPSLRVRILSGVAGRLGNETVIEALNNTEMDAGRDYVAQGAPEALQMAADERAHARAFQALAAEHIDGSSIASVETEHKASGGNALRAGVMGANDGLVSNFCLVMGMAGATEAAAGTGGRTLLVTGIAGLLAGAISMALGEWLSVQSSRELYERQIAVERDELKANPEEEIEELSLIYQAKGMDEDDARKLAQKLAANPKAMLDTLAREELGINPQELGGSAWEAAYTSFLLFAVGAIIPVLPFIFMPQNLLAIGVSAILSLLGLFGLGAATTLLTGQSLWYAGSRQAIFGMIASAVTFGIGHLIGVQLG